MRKSPFYFHLYKRGLGLCCTFYPVRPLTLTLSRRAREYNASLHKGGAAYAAEGFSTFTNRTAAPCHPEFISGSLNYHK